MLIIQSEQILRDIQALFVGTLLASVLHGVDEVPVPALGELVVVAEMGEFLQQLVFIELKRLSKRVVVVVKE